MGLKVSSSDNMNLINLLNIIGFFLSVFNFFISYVFACSDPSSMLKNTCSSNLSNHYKNINFYSSFIFCSKSCAHILRTSQFQSSIPFNLSTNYFFIYYKLKSLFSIFLIFLIICLIRSLTPQLHYFFSFSRKKSISLIVIFFTLWYPQMLGRKYLKNE